MSRSDLALPCSRTCSGFKPAASAMASSPADATSQPRPSSARTRVTGAQGRALEAKCTSVSGWRVRNASRYSRAVSRSPCSSNTSAGVPNWAATSASATPPTVSRPSSATRAVCGRIPIGPEYLRWRAVEIDVFTLFPQWFDWFRTQRHVANAIAHGLAVETIDPRATTPLRAGKVDDLPFGGGAGMVLRVDVVEAALHARYGEDPVKLREHRRVIALAP